MEFDNEFLLVIIAHLSADSDGATTTKTLEILMYICYIYCAAHADCYYDKAEHLKVINIYAYTSAFIYASTTVPSSFDNVIS